MIPTISYSRMNVFTTCPLKWYKQYIEGATSRQIPAFAFGSATHNYIEGVLLKEPYPLGRSDYTGIKNDDELTENISKTVELGDKALEYLVTHEQFGVDNLDDLEITNDQVEKKFKIDIANGFFKGFIDFWFVNKKGEIVIIDWKTTSQKYKVHQIRSSQQLTGYAYAYYRLYGKLPDKVAYVTMNKKNSKVKAYMSTRTKIDIMDMEKRLQTVIEMMKAEVNYKDENGCFTGPDHKWKCDFYNECWDLQNYEVV